MAKSMSHASDSGTLKIGSKVYSIERFDMRRDRNDVEYWTRSNPGVTQRVAGPVSISGELQLGDIDCSEMVGEIGDVTVNSQRINVIIERVNVSCDTHDSSKLNVCVEFKSTGAPQPSKWDDMIDLIAEVCDG